MIVAIVGSRDGLPWPRVKLEIGKLLSRQDIGAVVSGGAIGVDRLGEVMARDSGITVHSIRPDWQKHGRGAGFIRNKQIVEMADEVHAWWNGKSRGTANTIETARKMGKTVVVHTHIAPVVEYQDAAGKTHREESK